MKTSGLECCLCGKVALRIAKGKGYCKDHTQEAFDAVKTKQDYKNPRAEAFDYYQSSLAYDVKIGNGN